MVLSARNRLAGTVESVEVDGGQTVTAVITSGSAERLDLEAGDEVNAVVKATDVMVENR